MKKAFILVLCAFFCFCHVAAQSTMSDEDIMSFVVKEKAAGTSNSQIVTKLMQRGVSVTQMQRLRREYESGGLDALGNPGGKVKAKDSRLRTNEKVGATDTKTRKELKEEGNLTSYRMKDLEGRSRVYDEDSPEFLAYQNELQAFVPDSMLMLKMLLKEKKDRKNKVFGRDIFNNEELSFEPNMNIATPQDYRLGPGDAVIVDVYGASQDSFEETVSPEGEITIEGFGPVSVGGLTVEQANRRLRNTLGRRYSSSQVRLTVGQTKTISVNVMGEVKTPGTYTLSAFATVFHALYMAGGTNDLGTLRDIKVYRDSKLVSRVDIYDYILNGKLTGNVRLGANDVIVVGPYDCLVKVDGKVKRPMIYEMRKDESLASLLKYSGGFASDAYTKSVRVIRKTGREYAVFNVDEFDFASFRVADGDSVSVDSILPRYENTVEVKGAVFRPGLYQMGNQINSVRSLIEYADGLTEEAFTARAVMHRMKPDRTLEVLSVDVEGILDGTSPDIPLRENDVLFIPTKQEMAVERTITIRGEVMHPGVYKYADNETVEDFILQAGGLTEKASVMKVDISRRVGNPYATEVDSVIGEYYSLKLKDGFVIDGEPGFVLMPFDEVYVRKSPGYNELQNVEIAGEVMFAGTYPLTKRGSRLSDLLKASGGPTPHAYIKGAKLLRKPNEVEKERMEAAYRIVKQQEQRNLMEMAVKSNNATAVSQMAEQNKEAELEKFKVPEFFPVGIDLEAALEKPGSDADMVLREGDRLVIPQYNGTVKVNGAVMYPNTVAYKKGKKARYYIDQAGGFASDAKKSRAYIIYMNGEVAQVAKGGKIQPGCEIVVPTKSATRMSPAEIISIGTGFASIATMIATIANILK